jgi:hypothetical protein
MTTIPRGRKRTSRKMTDRLTIPMTPEMLRSVVAAADKLKVPAAEWVRRLIKGEFETETGEAA